MRSSSAERSCTCSAYQRGSLSGLATTMAGRAFLDEDDAPCCASKPIGRAGVICGEFEAGFCFGHMRSMSSFVITFFSRSGRAAFGEPGLSSPDANAGTETEQKRMAARNAGARETRRVDLRMDVPPFPQNRQYCTTGSPLEMRVKR